ncbi:pirin family protein [Veillonella rodentium]|uniref:Quercetin 2,3-dioxygenase n=1 Tax=Veillonella rodentium TaxID=248315 RepID=A0A239Y566_9FIRM|nr:pirin family protein [Veillonella rodentium]SNV54339.1 Quercetin 2,3-dioxygenase [Veillonella rodentium]
MTPIRTIEQIIKAPDIHWVGTGFRVRQYFPNGDTSPMLDRMSPFLLLDYNEPYYFQGGPFKTGVNPHPHKGFETVTFCFSGSIAHKDTAGNTGIINSGDVQWMTAARGILHEEFHETEYAKRGRLFHALQLWINLPERYKNDNPSYQYLSADMMGYYQSLDETIEATVYTGTFRHITGPGKSYTPMNIYKLKLRPDSSISISEQATWNTGFLVLSGSGSTNGESYTTADFVLFNNDGDCFEVEAGDEGLELFVLSGEPINEPVVKHGPFVMTDSTELLLAFGEYKQGKFGREEDLM